MGTTAQVFYAGWTTDAVSEWDGTDPVGGDVRKLRTDQPPDATDSTNTFTNHGTGQNSIVVDPFTTRATTGTADQDKFGWAINLAGSDGMDGTASALRRTPAGVWNFVACLNLSPSLSNYTVRAHVYRVSADGTTRTLLFSSNESAQAIPAVRTIYSFASASQPDYTFSSNESLLVSYTVRKVDATAVGEIPEFKTGRALSGGLQTNLCTVTVPPPGVRTQYQESVTTTAVATATATAGTKLVTGIVYDSAGAVVNGATVKLFNQSTDTKISERASGADGSYRFTRTDIDTATYYVVGFNGDTLHGTSDRGLTAT